MKPKEIDPDEFESDEERLEACGRKLMEATDDPLLREKIALILTGKSANH